MQGLDYGIVSMVCGNWAFAWTSKGPNTMDPILPILSLWDIGPFFWALLLVQVRWTLNAAIRGIVNRTPDRNL